MSSDFPLVTQDNHFFHALVDHVSRSYTVQDEDEQSLEGSQENKENGECVPVSCGVESLHSRQTNAPSKTKHD